MPFLYYPWYVLDIYFHFFRQEMIASKMGPFWPGLIATFLASMVTLTSTTRSNGDCESEDDHFYLIKHRFVFCVLDFLSILSYFLSRVKLTRI